MEQITAAGSALLETIVCAVVTALCSYALYGLKLLYKWGKSKIAQIQDADLRRVLEEALTDLERLTDKTVATIEQTTAKTLRQMVKDGAATEDDLKALGKQAVDEIAEALGPQALAAITANYGRADEYIRKCVEAKVLELKARTAAVA